MAKPKYSFNDIDAAQAAVTKAKQLSEKVAGLSAVISRKVQVINGLNNTFSANIQVCNRYDQLSAVVGEFVEPLNNVANEINRLVQTSKQAMELSKSGQMI